MTNEEIIKGLQAVNEHIGKHFNEGGAWMAEFIDNAIKALEQTRWIPVSERLPNESADVLCNTDSKEIFISTYYGKMNSGIAYFVDNNGRMWEDDVIAWMPLPKPYTEVSRDD